MTGPAAKPRATPLILGHLLVPAALNLRDATAQALAPLQLTPREFGLLNQVVMEPGLSQARLGELLRIDRSTTVLMLDRLCERGWVERTADEADRRVYRIRPSRSGLAAHGRAAAEVAATEQRFLAPIGPELAAQLHAALLALHEAQR
jgi:DNA-binding MarR family transcriptional regulator